MSLRSYLARPAKSIERLMLVDALRRLAAFGPLKDYAYVGLGAHEFIDFELLWRTLGITEMTSIERSTPIDRFEFNRPFGNIVVRPGSAAAVLPRLSFKPHTIVWLDYTGKLNVEVLNDTVDTARRLSSGSALIVTVNAEPETVLAKRRKAVVARLGEERVPSPVTDASLAPWGLAQLSRDILSDEVTQAMRTRTHPARFEQLFNFRYADGAKMVTWGGLVVADQDRAAFDTANFGELDFVRSGADQCELAPPSLTIREIVRLNEELPMPVGAPGPFSWMTIDEVAAYGWLHRWYPSVP